MGQNEQLKFISVVPELGKLLSFSSTNNVSAIQLRLHRMDTLRPMCSLIIPQSQHFLVVRTGLGADIFFSSGSSIQKARYEENVRQGGVQYSIGMEQQTASLNTNINSFSRNSHILTVAGADGHIYVLDASTLDKRYARPGGSMNPSMQPKSYLPNPAKPGFSDAFVDETKVVGVMGNLIRVYDYEEENQ